LLLPVPAVYLPSLFALEPASASAQPFGSTSDWPDEASVLKSWVYAVSIAVRLDWPAAVPAPATTSPSAAATTIVGAAFDRFRTTAG
jgi:hypothetical protein